MCVYIPRVLFPQWQVEFAILNALSDPNPVIVGPLPFLLTLVGGDSPLTRRKINGGPIIKDSPPHFENTQIALQVRAYTK